MTGMSMFAVRFIAAFAQPVFAITIGEAVDMALKNNPDLQSVRLEKETAQGRLDQAGLLSEAIRSSREGLWRRGYLAR